MALIFTYNLNEPRVRTVITLMEIEKREKNKEFDGKFKILKRFIALNRIRYKGFLRTFVGCFTNRALYFGCYDLFKAKVAYKYGICDSFIINLGLGLLSSMFASWSSTILLISSRGDQLFRIALVPAVMGGVMLSLNDWFHQKCKNL